MIIHLSWGEMYFASFVAMNRHLSNLRRQMQPRYGARNGQGTAAGLHIAGCQGEMAVAKALNLFWGGSLGDFDAVDVGGLVQVRSTENPRAEPSRKSFDAIPQEVGRHFLYRAQSFIRLGNCGNGWYRNGARYCRRSQERQQPNDRRMVSTEASLAR
jgi:hypothetical protein